MVLQRRSCAICNFYPYTASKIYYCNKCSFGYKLSLGFSSEAFKCAGCKEPRFAGEDEGMEQ